MEKQVLGWAGGGSWEIRETSIYPFIAGIKHSPEAMLSKMEQWARSDNPNVRRVVAESLRPRAEIKWLRDETKNDRVLEILQCLRQDHSEYVRKSVGNNLKDLTKYMPEKILAITEAWVESAGIKVCPDLASRSKKELGEDNFYLIWTLKQAMRWIQARKPEFHSRLEKVLGANYTRYYEEKRNKSARPPESRQGSDEQGEDG